MTLLQELGIFEAIAGDIVSFAGGNPISRTQTIAGVTVTATVVVLPAGPTPGYQVFTGSFLSILLTALADFEALAAGAPIQIAEKIGNTWYGTTLAVAIPAKAVAA